jgi:DNA-binding protein Fis
MKSKKSGGTAEKTPRVTPSSALEEVIEKKLADITTVLSSSGTGRSRLYEEVLEMVERSLFKIALERNKNVKGAAATYLGINRNTFQNKMVRLGICTGKNDVHE